MPRGQSTTTTPSQVLASQRVAVDARHGDGRQVGVLTASTQFGRLADRHALQQLAAGVARLLFVAREGATFVSHVARLGSHTPKAPYQASQMPSGATPAACQTQDQTGFSSFRPAPVKMDSLRLAITDP